MSRLRGAPTPSARTALGAAAARTNRIGLATAVALPVEHDPITLAKSIATLDHLSGGHVDRLAAGGVAIQRGLHLLGGTPTEAGQGGDEDEGADEQPDVEMHPQQERAQGRAGAGGPGGFGDRLDHWVDCGQNGSGNRIDDGTADGRGKILALARHQRAQAAAEAAERTDDPS